MRTHSVAISMIGLVVAAATGAAPAAHAAAQPVSIPFTIEDGNIVVTVKLGSGPPLPFVFDSGLSNGNVISPQAAKKLGLEAQGDLRYGDTSGQGHSAKLARVPGLHVGSAVLKDQLVAITDLPGYTAERGGKQPIAGFLGAPLMDDAVLCIDYRKKLIQRWKRSDFDSAGFTTMPMRLNHGLPTATAIIDGLPATVVVDTGNNSGVSVFPVFADANDLHTRYPDMEVQQGTSGSGQTFDVLKTVVEEVAVSQNTSLARVPLTVIPQTFDPSLGIDGLLGFGILSRLNPCLDRDGQRLMWKAG